jgi:uncharacterized protein
VRLTPFHVAVQVRDIAEARAFYGGKLGFDEGRSDETWVDYNFFGHQFVVHLNPALGVDGKVHSIHNPVDEHAVPIPHYGLIMPFEQWEKFAEKMRGAFKEFVIEPYIRFAGKPGEQGMIFFLFHLETRLSLRGSGILRASFSSGRGGV